MNETDTPTPEAHPKTTPTAARWTGRVLSGLVGLAFIASAAMKFMGGEGLEEGFAHLGLPMEIQYPLAILELVVAIIYLIPPTCILGAILLTGYVGGTILAHWRVGDPVIINIVLGVVVWLGVFLRDRRLWSLIPIRL